MGYHAFAVFFRYLLSFWAAAVLFWMPAKSSAEQGSTLEMGVKAWLNEWKREEPGTPGSLSSGAVLVGPELRATYGGLLFLRAAMLYSDRDYQFSDLPEAAGFERRDSELAAGLLIGPDLALTGGYRQARIRQNETGLEQTLTGPTAGFNAIIRVYEELSLHIRYDYQFTRLERDTLTGSFEEKSPGWIGELAIGYRLTRALAGTLGYRSETNKGEDSASRDIFSGISGGLYYIF